MEKHETTKEEEIIARVNKHFKDCNILCLKIIGLLSLVNIAVCYIIF